MSARLHPVAPAALLASACAHAKSPSAADAVSQFGDWGLSVAELLVVRGADLALRIRLPGHYDRPEEEVVECTPLGLARLFPGAESKTVAFLHAEGAAE